MPKPFSEGSTVALGGATAELRARANTEALRRFADVRPALVGIMPAGAALGIDADTVLTSGPTMEFADYVGGQLAGIVGGVLYEGLARDEGEALEALRSGRVQVRGCQDYDCVGSLAGITTASMPVIVVEDQRTGLRATCTLYEGDAPARLNYGSWTPAVKTNLAHLADQVAPAMQMMLAERHEALKVLPIMTRAVTMGDELHSRNVAATALLLREFLRTPRLPEPRMLSTVVEALSDDYFFLRVAMATSKLMAMAMHGVPNSSIVTAMAFSCREFGIKVSGLGDSWFTGPLPTFEDYRLEDGFDDDDIEFMGGESTITEVIGLGGMAQAGALSLQRSSGHSARKMIERTERMYQITCSESPYFKLPILDFRGVPFGIDLAAVTATGVTPYLDIGIAGRSRRQIGGGVAVAPLAPFVEAWEVLNAT